MTASLVRHRRVALGAPPAAIPNSGSRRGIAPKVAQFFVKVLSTTLMVAAIATFLFLAVGPRVLGYQTSTMLTGSMSPLINPGDVVVTVPVPVQDLKVGDIITYHIPVDDQRVETHRIVDLAVNNQGTATLRTKGDANNGADPWTASLAGGKVDRQLITVPYLGNAIRTLRDPLVLKVLMYGAPAALVVMLLVSIWRKGPKRVERDGGAGEVHTLEPLPTLDRRPLRRLAEELKSKEAARNFAAEYSQMLPQRVDRICHALSTGNNAQSMDAVLSLKTSSSMVGAVLMEEHCVRLERALVMADHSAAAKAGEEVRQHQPHLQKALVGSSARRAA